MLEVKLSVSPEDAQDLLDILNVSDHASAKTLYWSRHREQEERLRWRDDLHPRASLRRIPGGSGLQVILRPPVAHPLRDLPVR